MKSKFLSFACLLVALGSFGQPDMNVGLKGGFTASRLEFSENWEYETENNLSYHLGAFARAGWGRFYLQPEAYFNSRGGNLSEIIDENPVNTLANFDFTSVDVPLLAGLKLVNKEKFNLRVMGGPVFGFITSGNVEGDPAFNAAYFRDHFYGWQYGAGLDIWMFTLDMRIENSRNSVYKSSGFSTKNRLYLISLGIKFF